MYTIAIVNEKGGAAKTTTAVNLSAALGEMGKQVLLVDLDGQAASSRWLGVEEDTNFADALWRGEGLRPIPEVIPGVSLAPGALTQTDRTRGSAFYHGALAGLEFTW